MKDINILMHFATPMVYSIISLVIIPNLFIYHWMYNQIGHYMAHVTEKPGNALLPIFRIVLQAIYIRNCPPDEIGRIPIMHDIGPALTFIIQ